MKQTLCRWCGQEIRFAQGGCTKPLEEARQYVVREDGNAVRSEPVWIRHRCAVLRFTRLILEARSSDSLTARGLASLFPNELLARLERAIATDSRKGEAFVELHRALGMFEPAAPPPEERHEEGHG